MTRSTLVLLFLFILIVLTVGIRVDYTFPITKRVEDVQIRQDDGLEYRLPNNTRPETYDITLTTRVDEQNFTFHGNVKIGIYVVEPTSLITLHHRQLAIVAVRLWTRTVPTVLVNVDAHTYESALEFLRIPITGAPLPAGNRYMLDIDYTGILREDNYGFYRSSYTNDDGDRIWQATTQFEPTDARHGFPCYDEPQLKAIFTVTINHGSSYTALSNMPVSQGYPIDNLDGTTTTQFDTTPPMSSYLNAIVVSDFISLETTQGKVPHRVYARPNAIHKSHLILDAGVKVLDALSDYLGVEYSLPKMDQVAVPDFSPGAMENWGIVTYRELRFFYEEDVSEYYLKTAIISVMAHEFGHMWFGNLVSPKWWSYIWLNEGFANLVQHIGTDLVYPEWRIMDYYVISTLQNVFLIDSLQATRPMTYYAESPSAVSNLFDNIAYAKSGCVLRMFLNALSESTFVKGLNKYLTAKAYSVADEQDLFDALHLAIQEDNHQIPTNFSRIMSSWTRQPGYPVLRVNRNYESGTVTVSQQRYFANSSATPDSTTWWIPYNLATATYQNFSQTTASHWLAQNIRSEDITVPELNPSDWLIVNKKQTGYYRVIYDPTNYKLIADSLFYGDINRIHSVSRAQLLDDAFNFARSDQLSYTVFLDLTRFLAKDIDYVPWAAASFAFTYLNHMYSSHTNHHVFRDYVRKLTESIYYSVGIIDFTGEPPLRKYARSIALKWACDMGSSYCRGDALSKLRLLQSNEEFHQNVRPEMYCGALRSSTKADFDFVWSRLLSSSDPDYRNMLIHALACTTSNDLLAAYLSTSLPTTNPYTNVTYYRPDDYVRIFSAVYQSGPDGLRMAITFLIANVNDASRLYGNDNLVTIHSAMAQRITDHTLHAQFSNLTKALGPIIPAELAAAADKVILNNIEWIDKHGPVINKWLIENHTGAAATVVLSSLTLLATIFVSFIRLL